MSDFDDEEAEDEEAFTGKYEGGRNERNERHGFGKAVLPNKDLYEGNYMNGKRDGYGVYKFMSKAAKGARYMGEYYQGRKQGYGVFIYPDGSRYEGNWINDMKEGTGSYFYYNGDSYQGDWFQDVRHGNGTYTFKRASLKYVGAWHKGKIQGYGTFVYPHYKFNGRFRSNKPYGMGKFVFDTSCEIHGKYILSATQAGFSDIEQEAVLLAVERALVGGGEDDEGVVLEDIVIPGTPPPLDGDTSWVVGATTGLHVTTEEEAEEARLVEELLRLRKKLETQLTEMRELEKKKAEEDAAKKARMEAERAALENMAQEFLDEEEGEGEEMVGEEEDKRPDRVVGNEEEGAEESVEEEDDNEGVLNDYEEGN